jgi:hypothetical protein
MFWNSITIVDKNKNEETKAIIQRSIQFITRMEAAWEV